MQIATIVNGKQVTNYTRKSFPAFHMLMRRAFVFLLACFIGVTHPLLVMAAEIRPALGAQIWIEPGQTPEQIEHWFQQLQMAGMPVARIFIMWAYIEPSPGNWDFSLYDVAFRAAEKNHVRVVATLTPSGPPTYAGGDGNQGVGTLATARQHAEAASYIDKVVRRYRTSPALKTWLLVNEPGQSPAPNPHAVQAFRTWLPEQYRTLVKLNTAWGTNFASFETIEPPDSNKQSWNHNADLDWRRFWIEYQTDELRWLAERVREADTEHPLHLNPAGILGNLAEQSDNLPAWRSFLDTLGCSIHPAWHFSLLDRDRYTLGVSYLNDLIRGSIEPKPYWVTELQGGNNIYSGIKPLEPTPADIAQWTWTSIGAGADAVIYWLLNARREGVEAGEWSLLNYQQQPSPRLITASHIARIIQEQEDFFSRSKPLVSPVTLILSLETMTFEASYHQADDPGRDKDAHILEALGFYEALSRIGIPPEVKQMDSYDWAAISSHPRVAIVPDARVLTPMQAHLMKVFVDNGNVLLISGLTGSYGTHAEALPLSGSLLPEITGSNLEEVHLIGTVPLIKLKGFPVPLPSRLWVSSVKIADSKTIALSRGGSSATESFTSAGGRVLWIPSPIGIGAWLTDSRPLALFLKRSLAESLDPVAFRFAGTERGCLLRVLESGDRFITVVANATDAPLQCVMVKSPAKTSTSLWGTRPKMGARQAVFFLPPRETSVQLWR